MSHKNYTTTWPTLTIYRRRLGRDEHGRVVSARAYVSMLPGHFVNMQVIYEPPAFSAGIPIEVIELRGAAPALFGAE
jgi:hypothetical protein